MTKIRAGDIVTVRIRVTEVADYSSKEHPDAQQVMGTMLPLGGQVGWLIPQEAAVTLTEPHFKAGDEVWLDTAQSRVGKVISMHTVDDEHYLWVLPRGERVLVTVPVKDARRID